MIEDRGVVSRFESVCSEQAHASSLPPFLRKFTQGSVMAYVLTKAVDACEKLRDYSQAVQLLRILLSQDLYLIDYRGLWYERLTLDLDQVWPLMQFFASSFLVKYQEHPFQSSNLQLFSNLTKMC